jgi:hypothetical protein
MINLLMKDKIKNYLGILIFALLFLVLYWLLKGQARYLLIYFLIPAGLFISFNAPFSLILFNFIGLVLLFISGKNLWWLDSWVLVAMFMVLGIFPFYSRKVFVQEEKNFSEQKKYLIGNVEGLKNELSVLEKECKNVQNEVERITRLYLLGREFVEQMDMKETIDHLKISIFDRKDIKSVSIFAYDKQSVTPIYLSKRDELSSWSEFAAGHKKLVTVEKSPKVLSTPSWLKDSSVILWPIRIEEEITVAVFFAVNINFVDTCI